MVCEKAAESLHHAERNCTQRTDTSLADERGEVFMSEKNHFIPLIRIAITMAYAARAVHPCARFLYWQLPAVATYWKPLISLAVK